MLDRVKINIIELFVAGGLHQEVVELMMYFLEFWIIKGL